MNTPNAGWIDGVEPGDADLAALLRAVPERPFRDVSGAVVQTIVHRRRRRRMAFAGFGAAAAAAALVVMTWLPSTPVAVRPPVEAAAASRAAEDWLLTAQEADGTWDPARWGGSREYRPAVTGFAMMALVRDGDAAADGAAARAAQALRGMQGRDGRLGGARALHNHAIATGALLRLYETGRFPELFTVVDGAVNYIRVAQEASGGWGDAAGADVWLVDALARAEALGWRDAGGHLRRGLRALGRSGGEAGAAVAAAPDLAGKREAVAALCAKWIDANPVSRAGGRVYAASVAAR